MIYLDNAATTHPKPPGVAEAVVRAIETFGNGGRGTHDDALSAARVVYETRVRLAALFGCPRPDHVAFTANVTEALNLTISGLLGPGDHVISTDWEHNSVLRPLYRLRSSGGEVDFVPADPSGQLELEVLESLLHPNTKAVVCTHASNVTGDLLDIDRVGAFCQAHGLLFILDTAQTAGAIPVDMTRQHVDVVCFTGHKGLLGPQGTGGLCFREGLEIRPWTVGGTGVQSFLETQPSEYPTRLEAGTLNSHGLAGLHAALAYIEHIGGPETIHRREAALARRFFEGVRDVPGVRMYGDFSRPRAAIAALNLVGQDAAEVSDELAERFGIATRPGAHCAPRMHRALGTEEQGIVRFSWSYFNTEAETDAAIEAVRTLVAEAL